MKRAAVALVALLTAGCSSLPPQAIRAGDVCFRCRRVISDTRLAGEIIDSGGRAFKFRTPRCMATYLNNIKPDVGAIYVTDYQSGRIVKASAVTFVPTMLVDGLQREMDYVAFSSENEARKAAAREKTTPLDWDELLRTAVPMR